MDRKVTNLTKVNLANSIEAFPGLLKPGIQGLIPANTYWSSVTSGNPATKTMACFARREIKLNFNQHWFLLHWLINVDYI